MKKAFFLITLIVLGFLMWYEPSIKEIAAGMAIILFGMIFLEDGFKLFSGGPLEKFLKKTTDTLPKSLSFGFVSTSLLQSSGLISVITISFLSAGLMELSSGIGIIFGANIGTTSGAWLISLFGLKLNISSFALPMLAFGVVFVLQKKDIPKGIGYVLSGIGFLFLGIYFMKVGFESFQGLINLKEYSMTGFGGLIVYTLIGIIITVLMQSSHASLAIILTALSTGQLTYVNALALAIGANIGTTVMALIGALSANEAGKRLAVAHLVFNLVTAIIAIAFINQLRWVVDHASTWVGIAENDYTLKLSMFHTIFNVIGVLIMLPFIKLLVLFLVKVIKEKAVKDISQPRYLSDAALQYVESAIPALIKESRHLFDNSFEIIAHGLNLHRADILSDMKLKEIVPKSTNNMRINIDELYYKKVKTIYSKIIEFATVIQSKKLSEDAVRLLHKIRVANRYLIEIIKHIRTLQPNMAKYIISNNESIKSEYNRLRLKIAKVIREVYRTQSVDNLEAQHQKLLELQQKAKLHDVLVNGRLDELIRDKLIDSQMATSLMNDSALVARICEKLINVAELLYIQSDTILEPNNQKHDEEHLKDFFEEQAL